MNGERLIVNCEVATRAEPFDKLKLRSLEMRRLKRKPGVERGWLLVSTPKLRKEENDSLLAYQANAWCTLKRVYGLLK